ncbi:MAG TPA: carboxypeptidase regulatory-like domain-containing protein, partial [Bacteroidetes bacterium]|nr:carboxypeptidase regulatory-like domain-containing protein [Bacteroidota bacterium]
GWIVVTDEDGDEDWSQAFGGEGEDGFSSITRGDEDNIMVAGKTNSFGEGGFDFWLLKINSEGEEVWSQTYGGDEDDQCLSVIRTDDDCYILAGTTVSFGENSGDFWLVKVDADGEEIWSRTFDSGGNELCRAVIQTIDGGYLLAGQTWPYDDARCDYWLVRTDEDGEELWSETYGGNQSDVCTDVVQTDDGGYALTGWTSSFGAGGLDMWVVRLGPEPAGVLEGFVLDLTDDAPLEGATITTTNGCHAETDEEGFFRIDPVWAGDFDVTASLQGYNDQTREGLNVGEGDTLEIVFHLPHPEFAPSRDSFDEVLEPGDRIQIDFSARNDGNGTLAYTVDRRLLGEANADPWSLRSIHNIEEIVEDNQLNGVLFVDGNYYVSGGNNGEDVNKIYVFNAEGEYQREFDQFHESRYGMRDLTWDGSLIWGADGTTLYGFNTDGELVDTIDGQARSYRSLTWDPDHEVFWSADVTSDIFSTDVDGNAGDAVEVPGDARIYGLSYWAEDPDGYNLYIFSRGDDEEVDIQVNKLNVETGEMVVARQLEVDGRPGGIFITNRFDVYSWVLIGIVQSPDRLAMWQLEARREWFLVEPAEGVIEAEDAEDFTLTLDATGLPPGNTFEGEIVFMHNAVDAETALDVTLEVAEGGVQTSRDLDLTIGWNLVSANLQPDDEDVEVIMSDLVDAGLLIMMKDGAGHF